MSDPDTINYSTSKRDRRRLKQCMDANGALASVKTSRKNTAEAFYARVVLFIVFTLLLGFGAFGLVF